MNKLSLNLEDYTNEQINNYALKFIKSKNNAIDYYNSEKGKEKYRSGSRRYYRNNRDKCLKIAKERHAKKVIAMGKKPQNRRGRPCKNKIDN